MFLLATENCLLLVCLHPRQHWLKSWNMTNRFPVTKNTLTFPSRKSPVKLDMNRLIKVIKCKKTWEMKLQNESPLLQYVKNENYRYTQDLLKWNTKMLKYVWYIWHVTMSMSKIKSDTDVEGYYRKTKKVKEEGEGVLSLNTLSVKKWLRWNL